MVDTGKVNILASHEKRLTAPWTKSYPCPDMRVVRQAAVALATLLAAACAGGDAASPSSTARTTAAPSPIAVTASVAATATPAGEPQVTATSGSRPSASSTACPPVAGGGATDVKVVDVRVGSHSGYDRITFEFARPEPPAPADSLPSFSLTRQQRITRDGSGDPVAVSGGALYLLVLQGASGVDLSGEQVVETYKGPKEFKPNFPALVELRHAGEFENVLSWGIGLNGPRCARASRLTAPLRLVLDIPHR